MRSCNVLKTCCAPATVGALVFLVAVLMIDGRTSVASSSNDWYLIAPEPLNINDSGQVVRWAETIAGSWCWPIWNTCGVLWENGELTYLPGLADDDYGNDNRAFGVNSSGQIVGQGTTTEWDYHAVLWTNGTITDLGTLGGWESQAHAINDSGQVVGYSDTAGLSGDYYYDAPVHAFLRSDGVMTDLGTLGGWSSKAFDVNADGQVVGAAEDQEGRIRAFFWSDGVMTNLGTLGGISSVACGINDSGQVVGWSLTANGLRRAFLWENDEMTDLGTLGGSESAACDINNAGQVVGWSINAKELRRGFLWDAGEMTELGVLTGARGAKPTQSTTPNK